MTDARSGSNGRASDINRRTVLRTLVGTGLGLAGMGSATSAVAAKGGPKGPKDSNGPGKNDGTEDSPGGPPDDGRSGPGGPPCHKDFACDLENSTYVKVEFVGEEEGSDCSFVEETNTGLLTITNWESKAGENCEPVSVEWETDDAIVTKVTAFGGTDCDTVEVQESGSSYDADQEGEAGLDGPGGNTAAISNLQFCLEPDEPEPQPECPSGTVNLAGYQVSDGEFVFEEGEDVVEFSNVETDDDGVKAFDFSSIDGSDEDSASEVLTTVTVAYGETVKTFEVDPDFDQDKRAGSVALNPESEGVESVWFCQAVYAEADFVEGPIIEQFCDEEGNNTDNYGSRKISSISWSSYNGQLDGVQGQFDGSWLFDEVASEIEVSYDPSNDYLPDEEFDQLSLSVFEIGDPTFKDNTHIDYGETKCRHLLHASDTDSSEEQDGTLRANLPQID